MIERETKLLVATGQKRVGKTYTTIESFIPYTTHNPIARKILIYDVNMEYTDYLAIALKDLKKYTLQDIIEIRRVLPRMTPDGRIANMDEMMGIMNVVLKSFAAGLLVLEDINKYMIGTATQEIIGTMVTNAHRDLDIIIHLQSLSAMTPRMWQNTNVIRFHKQQDDIDRYKQRIPYYELLKIAEFLVNTQYFGGNERFYCFVSGDEGYIRGEFTTNSLRMACQDYVVQCSSELKTRIRMLKGELNAHNTAVEQLTNQLLKKYNR